MSAERWSFEATPHAPSRGRQAIREFALAAQATARALDSISLCVSEAITNALMHAYRDMSSAGTIEMEANLEPDFLIVRVSDQGGGLEPRLDSPGLGLGLPLISQFADSSEIITPENGGTEVIMRFDLREQGGSTS